MRARAALAPTLLTAADARSTPWDAATPATPAGYALGALLGRGGMGEVVLATDEKFGRPVAIKRMRGRASVSAIERFEREARIQARLEHPSIVPVHDIGRDAEGRPFFSMKRLAGVTLAEVLANDVTRPRQQLLRAFVDVCRAIDLAHTRGVIHRDLKPSNIMLGDFGEVYVLDWGVARIVGEDDPAVSSRHHLAELGATDEGTVLGTPGYMAPEQARGEPVTTAADSYALGCILWEILITDEHAPPELDALCAEALTDDAAGRPSARGFADRVESYLDGDRDLERRRLLAAEHLERARVELARGDRGAAMKSAGRAIALDPELSPAVDLASTLILEPPATLPPECERLLAGVDGAFSRKLWGQVALACTAFFLFIPIVIWQGTTDPWLAVAIFAAPTALALYALALHRGRKPNDFGFLIGSSIAVILASRMFGMLVVLPGLLAIQLVGYVAYPPFMRRPWLPITTILVTFAIPLVLEELGVFGDTWSVVDDTIVLGSSALAIGGPVTSILLIAVNLVTFMVLGLFAWSLANARRNAQRAVEIQAWHLRKLLA